MSYDPRLIMPYQQEAYPPYVWFPSVMSPVECDMISHLAQSMELADGQIGNGGNEAPQTVDTYRKVKTVGLLPEYQIANSNLNWMFERMRDKVIWANDNYFHFDLHGLWQQVNYLQYDEPKTADEQPGHYDWHQDYGGGQSSQRKLSVIVQLSQPWEYDGCRLHLFTQNEFDPGHVGQGDMIVFPSWAVHRVTPITRGQRRALVSWVSGPPFR